MGIYRKWLSSCKAPEMVVLDAIAFRFKISSQHNDVAFLNQQIVMALLKDPLDIIPRGGYLCLSQYGSLYFRFVLAASRRCLRHRS